MRGDLVRDDQPRRGYHPHAVGPRHSPGRTIVAGLALTLLLWALGLMAGSDGWELPRWLLDSQHPDRWLIAQLRAPRTVGAWFVGACLGLAGALAQGLFRNPLADPYLLGCASGASAAVVLWMLVLQGAVAWSLPWALWEPIAGSWMVVAAFIGSALAVLLTLTLAGGGRSTDRLLLSGVVVGVVLGALAEMLTLLHPEVLQGRQGFVLGSTAGLDWRSVAWLAAGLVICWSACLVRSRVLDALTLGEATSLSLGLPLARLRLELVLWMSLATALAVAQAGVVAFVGLVAPQVVKRLQPGPARLTLGLSALAGGVLLLAADLLARTAWAPRELPVGGLTAVLGGGYLLGLLRFGRTTGHREG